MDAVIFDMDGVLLDTESVCLECWKIAGDEFKINDAKILFDLCIGQNLNDTLSLLANRLGGTDAANAFYSRTGELFREIEQTRGLSLMNGAEECLTSLKKIGIRLALASSTRREAVERQLKAAKIFDFFESVTTGDEVLHSKPAPDIYLRSLSTLNLTSEKCIAVEDSPNGVRSATSAGLRCVMIPDQIQPNEEIKSKAWKILPSLKSFAEIVSTF